ELLAGSDDLLHEADPERLGGVELLAGEEPAHRVAPPGDLRQAQGGAAEGEDPALDLDLAEAGVAGSDPDVGGEQQLDADGEAVALGGHDQRLAADAAVEPERVDGALGEQLLAARDGRADLGEVE